MSSLAKDSINNLVLEESYSSIMTIVDASSLSMIVVVWVPKAAKEFFFILHLSIGLSDVSPRKGGDYTVEIQIRVDDSQYCFMWIKRC